MRPEPDTYMVTAADDVGDGRGGSCSGDGPALGACCVPGAAAAGGDINNGCEGTIGSRDDTGCPTSSEHATKGYLTPHHSRVAGTAAACCRAHMRTATCMYSMWKAKDCS